jgi:hypothetical protein
LTTAGLTISNAYSGQASIYGYSYFEFVSATSFSGANLYIQGPVYLSESVTVDYKFGFTGTNGFSNELSVVLGFYDTSGIIGSGCAINGGSLPPIALPGQPGTESCSTGLVYIASPEVISLSSNLAASIYVLSQGDSASFQGTATLGPLQVYDASGNLIDSIDLNALSQSAATPEPGFAFLIAGGLLSLAIYARSREGMAGTKRQNR